VRRTLERFGYRQLDKRDSAAVGNSSNHEPRTSEPAETVRRYAPCSRASHSRRNQKPAAAAQAQPKSRCPVRP